MSGRMDFADVEFSIGRTPVKAEEWGSEQLCQRERRAEHKRLEKHHRKWRDLAALCGSEQENRLDFSLPSYSIAKGFCRNDDHSDQALEYERSKSWIHGFTSAVSVGVVTLIAYSQGLFLAVLVALVLLSVYHWVFE